jgi:hypothetical protein
MPDIIIREGDRVTHKTSKKIGTAMQDQHETMNGYAVYVAWDNGKTGYASPVNVKNLRKIADIIMPK